MAYFRQWIKNFRFSRQEKEKYNFNFCFYYETNTKEGKRDQKGVNLHYSDKAFCYNILLGNFLAYKSIESLLLRYIYLCTYISIRALKRSCDMVFRKSVLMLRSAELAVFTVALVAHVVISMLRIVMFGNICWIFLYIM